MFIYLDGVLTMLAVAALTEFQPEVFGRELERLREEARLSQRALARHASVSHTLISGMEAGTAAQPQPAILMKLARGLVKTGSGHIDERRADEAYFALMRAAGYMPRQSPTPDAQFRALLEARLGTEGAPLIEFLIGKMRGRPLSDVRSAVNVADVLLNSLPPPR